MSQREVWKILWRRMRVTKRETAKAYGDSILFGTGFCFVPTDGRDPFRVDPVHAPEPLRGAYRDAIKKLNA